MYNSVIINYKMNYQKLVSKIKWMFINEHNFQIKKIVQEFTRDNEFIADYFNYIMLEDRNHLPPLLYHVMSPYDVISTKSPQQAIVWNDGKAVLNIDFTEYSDMRTGAMDTIGLQTYGVLTMEDKNLLIFGTGNIAKWAIRILKDSFKDLTKIEYINSRNCRDEEFELFCTELGIESVVGSKTNLSNYDFILCHTSSKSSIIKKEDIANIKNGCVITNFTSLPNSSEVADEFYSENANVVLDWNSNLERAHEINRMVEQGSLSKDSILVLKDLLKSNKRIQHKDYTVFRFMGTPMQNLAILKLLLEDKTL